MQTGTQVVKLQKCDNSTYIEAIRARARAHTHTHTHTRNTQHKHTQQFARHYFVHDVTLLHHSISTTWRR